MSLTKVNYSMIKGAVFNVLDYGAKGDGATDDTAAIQAAIADAVTANGGTVYFPVGNYRISSTLVLPYEAVITLAGDGNYETSKGTRLRWVGSDNSSMIDVGAYNFMRDMFLYRSGGSYTNLIGVDVKGTVSVNTPNVIISNVHTKGFTTGFYFDFSYYVLMDRCRSTYCDYGIRLGTECNAFVLLNTFVSRCTTAGIYFEGTGSRGVLFSGCAFEGCAVGVDCTNGSPQNVKFDTCYFEANTANDIKLKGFSVVVDNCFFNGSNPSSASIDVVASNGGVTIKNCTWNGGYLANQVYGFPAVNPGFLRSSVTLGQEFWVNGSDSPKSHALVNAPWLITDQILIQPDSNVNYVMTDVLDASLPYDEYLISPGNFQLLNKRLVAAFLIIETQIVTNNTFRLRIGYSGASYDQIFDTTFTGTLAPSSGWQQLTLLQARVIILPPPYRWRFITAAGTSGKFRIGLVISD